MNNKKATYSWTVVVIMLIVFWPIGIFMLIGKLANDRTASFGGGSGVVRFIGFILVGFGAIMLFALIGDPELASAGIFGALLFGLPGLWLLKKGRQIRNKGNKNRAYINYIINNKINDVHELARRMGVSQEVVVNDVNNMINHGMLGRARLNLNNGKIEFPRPQQRPQPRPAQAQTRPTSYQNRPSSPHRDARQTSQQRPQPQQMSSFSPKTIRCSACSANNFVESLPAQCEYCGTSLHEK